MSQWQHHAWPLSLLCHGWFGRLGLQCLPFFHLMHTEKPPAEQTPSKLPSCGRSTPGLLESVKTQALQQLRNKEAVIWQVGNETGYYLTLGSSIPQSEGGRSPQQLSVRAVPGRVSLGLQQHLEATHPHLLWAQGPLGSAEPLRVSPGYLHTSSEQGSHLPVKVHLLVIQKIKSTGGPHEQCYM